MVEATIKQKVMLRQIHENQTRPHQKVMLHQELDKLIRFGKQMNQEFQDEGMTIIQTQLIQQGPA